MSLGLTTALGPCSGCCRSEEGSLGWGPLSLLGFLRDHKEKGATQQEKDLEVAVLDCKVGQNKWVSWREHRDGGGDQSTHKGVGQEGPVFLSGDEDLDMAVHRNGKETVGDLQARS